MRRRTVFVAAPGAEETVAELGAPGLRPTAEAIAETIPAFVPVQSGTVRRTYRPRVVADAEGHRARVYPGSPFWHWLEYGTRFNPAYRPVESAVRSLGLRYEAH